LVLEENNTKLQENNFICENVIKDLKFQHSKLEHENKEMSNQFNEFKFKYNNLKELNTDLKMYIENTQSDKNNK